MNACKSASGRGGQPGNVNIDRNVTVDSFKDVVALLERTARNGARAHCNHVFRIGHLIVKTHNLWRHFFGHGACDNHQVRLTRRWPKNFSAKTRDIIARRGRRDHLNRAASESELERPNRVLASPVVKLLHRSYPNPLLLQFAAQALRRFLRSLLPL